MFGGAATVRWRSRPPPRNTPATGPTTSTSEPPLPQLVRTFFTGIKEDLRHFWSYRRRGWAAKHFKRWYFWAAHCRLKPIIDAAKTLKRHEAGLLSYFAHPITNAGAEGLNSRIQAIRVCARGYRNREHFKTAIYFHLGGLQLYPATP